MSLYTQQLSIDGITLSSDILAALNDANSPSAGNVFATINDIVADSPNLAAVLTNGNANGYIPIYGENIWQTDDWNANIGKNYFGNVNVQVDANNNIQLIGYGNSGQDLGGIIGFSPDGDAVLVSEDAKSAVVVGNDYGVIIVGNTDVEVVIVGGTNSNALILIQNDTFVLSDNQTGANRYDVNNGLFYDSNTNLTIDTELRKLNSSDTTTTLYYDKGVINNQHFIQVGTEVGTISLENNATNIITGGALTALTLDMTGTFRDNDSFKIKFTAPITTIIMTGSSPFALPLTEGIATAGIVYELFYDIGSDTWY